MHSKRILTALVGFFAISAVAYSGSTFQIAPAQGYPFPTQVAVGGATSAYYLITNNTNSTRSGYKIVGLPSTVQQDTNESYCQSTITLHTHQSCILKLNISGAVASNFALCRESSCTSASTPLNIVLLAQESVISVGYYNDNTLSYPLIAVSTNSGWSWTYSLTTDTNPLPEDANGNSLFSSASCSDLHCIAAGYYRVNNGTVDYSPLIATSSNGGVSWHYTLTSTTPALPSDFEDAQDSSYTSCSGETCIASVDYHSTGGNIYPLIATSSNGGLSWAYTLTGTSLSIPSECVGQYSSGTTIAHITALSCNGPNCIGAGQCSTSFSNSGPLLASSTNAGQSWSYVITPSTPVLPNTTQSAQFNAANCSGSACIAVGSYRLSSLDTLPLVGYSSNEGVTWNYASNLDQGLPTACIHANAYGYTHASFLSASCTGSHCIAAGSCNTGLGNIPLVISSSNGGSSWSYTITDSSPTQPLGSTQMNFYNTSCSQSTCVVVGYYSNGHDQFPIVAYSSDSGQSWHYSVTRSTPSIPAQCMNGAASSYTRVILVSSDCKGTNCTASGYCETQNGTSRSPVIMNSSDGGISWTYQISGLTSPSLPAGTTGSALSATAY